MFFIVVVFLLTRGGSCDIELYVYNGTAVKIEQFPYLVSLQTKDAHFCGGAIYDTDLVVTAAHCIEFMKPEDVTIVAGRTNLAIRGDEEQILLARSFLLYPSYFNNRTMVRNDIALIRTSSRFSWRKAVQPALINPNWQYKEEESVNVAGWGETDAEIVSDQLLAVALDTQNDDKCRKAFNGFYQQESTFCLYSEGKDTCRGDSGSPTTNRLNQVVGLVSYGSKICGKKPMVATRVNYYLPWIEEQRKQLTERSGEVTDTANSITSMGLAVLHASTIQRQALESSQEEVCGSTWELNCFGKECFCYKLITTQLTWFGATERCNRYGGALVSIMSSEENVFVGKFVPSWSKVWIGLNDVQNSGTLVWPERTLIYASWHQGAQPDPKINRCVYMDFFLRWTRSECENESPSVCKVPVYDNDSGLRCQAGWAYFDGYCYQMQASLLSWQAASRNCIRKGAQLASVHSSSENDFVNDIIVDGGKDYVWIGFNDQEKEGVFVWSDDTYDGFTAWDRGQPDNLINPENCVSVHVNRGKWHDFPCWAKIRSLCKKKSF